MNHEHHHHHKDTGEGSKPHSHADQNHSQHSHHDHHSHMVADFKKRFWISLLVSIPILTLSPMLQSLFSIENKLAFPGSLYVLFSLSSFVFFYGGWPFLTGMVSEVRSKQPGMMTLIAVAIAVAYLYSSSVVFGVKGKLFFWELATLIDIMLVGHWIEMRSVMGASRALEELVKLLPTTASLVKADGSIEEVRTDSLQVGDIVLIKSGEKIPADGTVVEGTTSVDESMLSGESVPVTKQPDDAVIGGSINGRGSVKVEIQKIGADSYLSQVINLVNEAQASKSQTQDLANKAARILTYVALLGGVTTFLVWMLYDPNFNFALERAVTVMVITCPHALGLAVPLVVAVSTSLSASHGLLIRDRAAFENARNLTTVVFDKTGTLTQGLFGVTDILNTANLSDEQLLQIAASLENHSEHPIADGIVRSATDRKLVTLETRNVKSITGKGLAGEVNNGQWQSYRILSPQSLTSFGLKLETAAQSRLEELSAQGKTVVFLTNDSSVLGGLALADTIRPESKAAIQSLQESGITCMMATGDNKLVAEWVAADLNLDRVYAEVLPEDKLAIVKELQTAGEVVAMTGDGVNDAPALAQADVGIAIGAGTDVAAETADIILVRSNPADVWSVIELGRATYRKMIQNLFWATGYNTIAIPLAAGVLFGAGIILSPAVGAVLMSMSTVIVAINAKFLRLAK